MHKEATKISVHRNKENLKLKRPNASLVDKGPRWTALINYNTFEDDAQITIRNEIKDLRPVQDESFAFHKYFIKTPKYTLKILYELKAIQSPALDEKREMIH